MFKKSLAFLFALKFLCAIDYNLIEIMQDLQYDSDLIRQRFFQNDPKLLLDAIEMHKRDFSKLQHFDIKLFITKDHSYYVPIMDSLLSNIVEQRILMENFLKKNDRKRAFEAFEQLDNNCTKCHVLIRNGGVVGN